MLPAVARGVRREGAVALLHPLKKLKKNKIKKKNTKYHDTSEWHN